MFTLKSGVTNSYANPDDLGVVTQALRALGHYDHKDKNLDPLADADFYGALKKFQAAHGLPVTGEMTRMDATHRKMKSVLAATPARSAAFAKHRGDYEHRLDLVAWGEAENPEPKDNAVV